MVHTMLYGIVYIRNTYPVSYTQNYMRVYITFSSTYAIFRPVQKSGVSSFSLSLSQRAREINCRWSGRHSFFAYVPISCVCCKDESIYFLYFSGS
jgi:hypothetical protein